jgi:hypothetical protein
MRRGVAPGLAALLLGVELQLSQIPIHQLLFIIE